MLTVGVIALVLDLAVVMFRAFVFGVLATIFAAVVCGYIVVHRGLIPANADASPGWQS